MAAFLCLWFIPWAEQKQLKKRPLAGAGIRLRREEPLIELPDPRGGRSYHEQWFDLSDQPELWGGSLGKAGNLQFGRFIARQSPPQGLFGHLGRSVQRELLSVQRTVERIVHPRADVDDQVRPDR